MGVFSFAGASGCEDYCEGLGFWVGGEEFIGEAAAY
jgi:hypothetical protein